MSLGKEIKPALQTGALSPAESANLAAGVTGVEVIDLSAADPQPTAHFALAGASGATFQRRKQLHNGYAWQLDEPDDALHFRLTLPARYGVVLIVDLRRNRAGERVDSPVVLEINGYVWPVELDPLNLYFHRQSWYLPHYLLQEGENRISVRLASGAGTEVLLRSVAVMRFELQKQQQDNWCWAAVTAGLLGFFDTDRAPTQCEVVQECFSRTKGYEDARGCCRDGTCKVCDRTFKLVDALDLMGLLSARCNYPLSLDEIRAEIECGAPVAVRIGWRGGGGHFVVITAVGPEDPERRDQTWLRVADPKDTGASYISYRALKFRYKGQGRWTHTYTFRKQGERREARCERGQ